MNIYSHQKYVVYHITYAGDKLPPNYIGSTTIDKIQQGYKGSVCSKEFKSIWQSEVKANPHLFSVQIISYHDTRPAATYKELQIQKLFNVVKNPLFVNKAYASVNGFFGMNICGENNPNFGKTPSEKTKNKLSIAMSGENNPNFGKQAWNKGKTPHNKGKPNSDKTRAKISKSLTGKTQTKIICPHCNKTGGNTAMKRYHFDNCKFK
jgi:hypothetical protein